MTLFLLNKIVSVILSTNTIYYRTKDGSFYKCFYDDAKILWYIFDYVYLNDSVSFGTKAYSKVFD